MIFNSLLFIEFFTIFGLLYWFVFHKNLKLQNILLLVSSYIFYGWTNPMLLLILLVVSLATYFVGINLAKEGKYKRLWFNFGLLLGIGSLAYFKYFNFFITSFQDLFHHFDVNLNLHTFNILAPLGISFFTFRYLSYIFDVNKGKIKPTTDLIIYLNYMSFFPTLLMGPIDKAKMFVPQLEKPRQFVYSEIVNGLRQILWGLFKKMVIADNCAQLADQVYNHGSHSFHGSTLIVGAVCYSFQIYADFSGFSDMAIGLSRLLGFNVSKNFDFPFFAQNIADFWRKWHTTLTAWLTEYVFTPLSIKFRDYDKWGLIAAILINFTVIGIWHGANWTYVVFGFLNGCYYIPLILNGTMNKRKKVDKTKLYPSLKEFGNMIYTFSIVTFSWIFFRSDTLGDAFLFIRRIFSPDLFHKPEITSKYVFILVACFMLVEWFGRAGDYAIEKLDGVLKYQYLRWIFYFILLMFVLSETGKEQHYIYFNF